MDQSFNQILQLLRLHQDIEVSMRYFKDYGLNIQMYSDKTHKADSKLISNYDLMCSTSMPDILHYILDDMLTELETDNNEGVE